VSFDGVDTREKAEELRGSVLRAVAIDEAGALWVHELIGSQVFDEEGSDIGCVESVEANPASDLLILDNGRLIPLTFVTSRAAGRLTVSLPPGLLEL
jgi:16S rRNA processing protein RimM